MVKTPLLTVVVLLTVALCVGANTAVFAVVQAALLRGLPYPNASRIVTASDLAGGEVVDWRADARSFEALAALRYAAFNLTTSDRPIRLDGAIVTASFFDVMGVRPMLGRPFTTSDETGARVVVLADALWRARFASDPAIVGRTITLDGEPYTVAGVMPPQFRFPGTVQFWVPPRRIVPEYPQRPNDDMSRDHVSHYLTMYARLKPGVTLQAAQAEQRAIFTRMLAGFPAEMNPANVNVTLVPLRESLVGDLAPSLLMLSGVVALVLLIGCANIANLLMARASARAHEMGVRTALGANRRRIVRQLLTESALFAVAGGALGTLAAAWALPALVALSPSDIGDLHPALNVSVMLFALAVSIATGVVFGCAPAFQTTRDAVAQSLRSLGRSSDGRHGSRLRQALVIGECAASVALLVVAGLLIRSVVTLRQVDPGFDPAGRQTARIVLPPARYRTPADQAQFFERLLQEVGAAPGVTSAALAARLPFVSGDSGRAVLLDHTPPAPNPGARIRVVSAGYFSTLGQSLRAGREFTERDTANAPLVAVVNDTMARQFWPGENAIGHHFRIARAQAWIEIVGIAADVKHGSLREAPSPEFYQPFEQAPWAFMTLVVRTPMSAVATASTLDRALAAIDPELPTPAVQSMPDLIEGTLSMDWFEMTGLAAFAGVGLVLAVIGLYGVMSFLVSRRTREIGLRIALGASPSEIMRLVMGDGLRLTAAGVALGLVASLAAARAIQSWLFGVKTIDPATLGAVALLLSAVAALACYLPARRAMRVDPMTALRTE
jgi:putative ABC transport system permease protein